LEDFGKINHENTKERKRETMSDPTEGADDGLGNPWTRLSRAPIYDNPWITVYQDQVLRPDGTPGIYGVVHFRNRAHGIVALDHQDRLLLVGQYRYTLDIYSWELPKGGGLLDEEPLTSARRELAEETGFTARHWRELLRAHLSNSVSDEVAICYLATDLQPGPAQPDGTERLQLRWVAFSEALRMIGDGQITDAVSVMGIQQVALIRSGALESTSHPGAQKP
jgi:8-oxo-dGTP pyrophosphatase MutT (NUDIX family)